MGYTRERLAELSDILVQFLSYIENGRKTMTVITLQRVAAALNVTTDYIVNGSVVSSDNKRINAMLESLSPYGRRQAEKLLSVFTEAVKEMGTYK